VLLIKYSSEQIKKEMGWGMWHEQGRSEMHTGFWYGKLRERDYLNELDVDERILLK
jgi:hypothetical protein